MPVAFHIPGPLRQFTAERSLIQLEISPGASVADALQFLFAGNPGLRDRILTESGQLRQHVSIFVGDQNIRYSGGLLTPVPSNAEISIIPAISGGC